MLKKVTVSVLCLVALVFFIPVICLTISKTTNLSASNKKLDKISGTPVETTQKASAPLATTSGAITTAAKEPMDTITCYIKSENKVETFAFNEYIKCVVAAEMPVSFEEEALKAQAVAARTYTLQRALYYQKNGIPAEHHGALTCTDPTHCQAWISKDEKMKVWGEDGEKNWKKISDAVDSTRGLIMTYNGAPINAVFFSVSSGNTESAKNVWGSDIPYLQSVASPLDKQSPKYESSLSITKDAFKKKMTESIKNVDFKDGIFGTIERSNTGSIISIVIGKVKITGANFRKILNLRSTNIQFSVSGDTISMSVFGYGHGVGMSQYGANFLAQGGKTYNQILTSYYTGIKIEAYKK